MSGFNPLVEEGMPPRTEKKAVAWMVIFTDLVSLMLTFFVLLFSMSTLEVERWDQVVNSLSQTLNPSKTETKKTVTFSFNITTLFRKPAINLDYLASLLEEAIARDEYLSGARLMPQDDRLVISLPGDHLFDPGKAVLSSQARGALFTLGGVLRNIGNGIGINGHTDPASPAGDRYRSNWELSIGRAAAVANALKRAGYTREIIALGYGSSRFSALPMLKEDARNALGRRIDIVIYPTVGGS